MNEDISQRVFMKRCSRRCTISMTLPLTDELCWMLSTMILRSVSAIWSYLGLPTTTPLTVPSSTRVLSQLLATESSSCPTLLVQIESLAKGHAQSWSRQSIVSTMYFIIFTAPAFVRNKRTMMIVDVQVLRLMWCVYTNI